MTGVEKIKEVRQLRYVEGLPIREITRRVNLSRNTVRKILRSQETKFIYHRPHTYQPVTGKIREMIETWLKEDLTQKPKYRRTAWRMYEILTYEHGYTGSYESIAKCVKEIRKKVKPKDKEAYIPLIFPPAEAFQFDWGEVQAYIAGKLVTLQLGIVVLCYSRHFYLRVYPCQKQELLLDVHRRAFEFFGGVCRRGIYDNLKTAVQSLLKGHHRNLQEKFAMFCSHYLFEPQFCNPASAHEKGQVENLVGYVRRNFFVPLVSFDSLEELNSRLLSFAIAAARNRKHPEFLDRTRYEAYEEEKEKLIQLPPYGFECFRVAQAVVSPCCLIHFDNNWYSVPDEYVGNTVMVKGGADEVIISYGGREIARHHRSYRYKEQILNPYHYLGVLARKPGALRDGKPFKNWQLPQVFSDYQRLLNQKYPDGDKYFVRTLILLKDYSLKDVIWALNKALSLKVGGDSYVLSLLRQRDQPQEEQGYLSIRIELARYEAKQRPLDYYDRMLRFRGQKEVL